MAKTRLLEISCVGMRHRITPATMREMDEICPLKVTLKREPENHHDTNAIAIVCDENPWKGMQVGYIGRQVAEEIAPRLDRKRVEVTEAYLTGVDADSGIGDLRIKFLKIR